MASVGTAPGEAFATGVGATGRITIGSAAGDSTAVAVAGQKNVSQLVALGAVQSEPKLRVSSLVTITLGSIPAKALLTSQVCRLALTQVAAKSMQVSQYAAMASVEGVPVPRVSQVAALALVRGNPGKRQLRAFTFNMDGHSFYVLQLGDLGTVVYDTLTQKWSEWRSLNYNNWKANYGISWNSAGVNLAGAIDSNIVYAIDPDYMFDDRAAPIVSTITGGFPMRMRASVACDEIMITSSVGWAPGTVNSQLQLRTSDDSGLSWRDQGVLDMSTATPQTEVSWRSLGLIQQPGRIFELTDLGGAAKRINSMDMFSRDLDNG